MCEQGDSLWLPGIESHTRPKRNLPSCDWKDEGKLSPHHFLILWFLLGMWTPTEVLLVLWKECASQKKITGAVGPTSICQAEEIATWTRSWRFDCFSKTNGTLDFLSRVVSSDQDGPKPCPSLQIGPPIWIAVMLGTITTRRGSQWDPDSADSPVPTSCPGHLTGRATPGRARIPDLAELPWSLGLWL